jgi:hypothetical protein
VRGHLSAGTAAAWPGDAPGPLPQARAYLAQRCADRLALVCCPVWAAVGVQECHASLVAAGAGGWHAGRDASAASGDGRGTWEESLGVGRRRGRFVPLGRGRRGRRARGARPGEPPPQPHRGARQALGAPRHAGQGGGAGAGGAVARGGQGAHGPTRPPPHASQRDRDGERVGCDSAAATATATWSPGTAPAARLADEEKPWPTPQKSGATVPSRTNLCLVSEAISSPGRPLGTPRGVLRGVPCDGYDPHLDSEINSGTDS